MNQLITKKGERTMKAVYRAALILVAFVLLFPLSARSEIKEGSVEVEPFVGYHFFANDKNLKNGSVDGGRVGYNFTNRFGAEVAMETIRTHVDDKTLTGSVKGEFRSPMDSVKINFYHIDAVYHFVPDGKFNPFIVAGFGNAHYKPSISNKAMATFDIGLGAKWWISKNVAFRIDLKDNIVTEIFDNSFHNGIITFGITIALGGKSKPAPAKIEAAPAPEPVTETAPAPEPAIAAAPVPEPVILANPEPAHDEPIIIFVSEPAVEEKVVAIVAQPEIEKKVIVLVLEDIHFDFDSSALTKEAREILKRNIQILNENPKAKVRIAGYTSASGTDDYNQKLSERRANAVKDYLISENVATPERLSVIGYGETKPAEYEATPDIIHTEAAKANKRVLFQIAVK